MSDLDRLFAAWLAGPLSDLDAQHLLEALRDPHQRRRWRALGDLEGGLAERGAAVEAESLESHKTASFVAHRPPRTRASPRRRAWAPALVAGVLLIVLGAGWWLRPDADADLPSRDGFRLARGATVAGPATVVWPDGSEARLAAGGQVRVPTNGRGLELDAGDVAVHVAHQTPGEHFVVRSPQALTQVIGTRFRLRCTAESTSLLVDEGRVVFQRLDQIADGARQDIVAGGHAVAGLGGAPSADLIAWWPLNDGSGAVARDASGNGHHGQISGAQWTADGLRFAGGDDHVEIPARGALATVQNGDYSLSAWFQPASLPPASGRDSLAVILGRSSWTLGLYADHDGRFFMQHFLVDRTPQTANSSTVAVLGRWFHLVGVVDRRQGLTHLAVDGRLVQSTATWRPDAAPYAYTDRDHWRIGISTPAVEDCRWPAIGLIREVRIYARALDEHEIVGLSEARWPQ